MLVKVASSGMSEIPLANKWRERSRVLYSLSLTSPSITRYGSFGGTCFQNSACRKNIENLKANLINSNLKKQMCNSSDIKTKIPPTRDKT